MPALDPLPGSSFSAGSAEPDVVLVPARFNERFIAYILDVIPFAAGYCLTMVFGLERMGGAGAARKVGAAWLAIALVYQFLGNLSGGTVGKKLMGLRVLRRDGEPLGFARSLVRAGGYLLSMPLFNFGFLLALLHPESRTLHDLLAGSVVVEPRRKHPAEAAVLFAAAALTMIALYGAMIYLNLTRPTPGDLLAIEKAREGLVVMAKIEDAHKESHGAYTDSLAELAAASGDAAQFRTAMAAIFDPHQFRVQAGNKGYRISAAARDRRKTVVAIEGPPARAIP